ncbi:hypothetical protein D3C80_1589470 [compost metagenome]
MGLGASLWASGSQACIGNSPVLVPKPIRMNTNARCISIGSNCVACLSTSVQKMASLGSGIKLAALAYTRMVPNSPKATPTVQIMMYFQAASSEELCPYNPTRNAELSVVASMAAHIRIRLLLVITNSMVNRNRWKKP